MSLTLTNATLVDLAPARVRRGAVTLDAGLIHAVGAAPAVDAPASDTQLDCRGALVLPGFVCAHTHLYSTLARGMPAPRVTPHSFRDILEQVWWKLDRALDAEAVQLSALVGALEALHAGTTTLVDHHASPSCIDGSLDLVAEALEQVGLRGVLAYEVSDRGGPDEARAGLRENDRFLQRGSTRRLLRGMVGAHAAFTLSNATAEGIAGLAARHQAGVHIHLAEDGIDAEKDGVPTVTWLRERGLLDARSLVAHAVHASDRAAAELRELGVQVAHNPRSNQNNRVGYARPSRFGAQLLLGTDGIGADMRAEAQAALFAARAHGDPLDPLAALERNRAFAAWHFQLPMARLEPGAAADLVVLDYRAPTPLDESNLAGHLLYGLGAAAVRHVIVDGKLVLQDGKAVQVDEERVYMRAREAARKLWQRMG